jgi:hypothetical protein
MGRAETPVAIKFHIQDGNQNRNQANQHYFGPTLWMSHWVHMLMVKAVPLLLMPEDDAEFEPASINFTYSLRVKPGSRRGKGFQGEGRGILIKTFSW